MKRIINVYPVDHTYHETFEDDHASQLLCQKLAIFSISVQPLQLQQSFVRFIALFWWPGDLFRLMPFLYALTIR